jgi:mannose/fructose/N-acetylgalactosamine-specific phosphotransferase system component IIC
MTGVDAVAIVLVGAIVGFDTVSFPQAMIARPIVAATLGGALGGSVMLGVLCGAVLECFALETLPVGASRYPEWGSASLVGGAIFADTPTGSAGALIIAVLVALSGAWLGGWSMVELRTLNAKRARRQHDAVASGEWKVIRHLQVSGLVSDLLRGAALSAVLLALALPLRDAALRSWPHSMANTRLIVAVAATAVAASAVWKHFSGVPFARPIMFGALVVGLALSFII